MSVTSFVQYLLLAPSYINVLNVYAFSNVHDVSWGTKGSDKVSEDLGVVKSSGGDGEVTVDVFSEQKDLNAIYSAELQVLATKPPKEVPKVNTEQMHEDYYKNFRTNVLLAWTMTNAALALAILRVGSDGNFVVAQTYMAVMLYTVAGLACEFCECCLATDKQSSVSSERQCTLSCDCLWESEVTIPRECVDRVGVDCCWRGMSNVLSTWFVLYVA